jgi:hypothetical protein
MSVQFYTGTAVCGIIAVRRRYIMTLHVSHTLRVISTYRTTAPKSLDPKFSL